LPIHVHSDLSLVGVKEGPISVDLRDEVLNLLLIQLLPGASFELLLDFAEIFLRNCIAATIGTT